MYIINKLSFLLLKYLIAALLIVATTGNVAAQSNSEEIPLTEEERSWIAEHPVLKATNEMDWAPIDFVRSGAPAGFSIDYLNLVASKVGLSIEYVNGHTWLELVSFLKNKEIDIAHSLALNSEREEYLNFTDAYINLPMVYYGRHGSAPVRTIEDLKDLRVGAVKGWTSTDAYRALYPNLNVIEYETIRSALEGVSKGEIDTFSTILPSAEYIISRYFITGIEVIGDGFLEEIEKNNDLHLAARNDEPLLHSILTKAMNMVTEEEYIAISKKWLMDSRKIREVNLTSDEKQWLIDNNIIKVAVDPTLVPIDMIGENGEIRGISGAYLNKIAKILNVKFEWAGSKNWNEAVEMIASGEAQIYSAINPTAERGKTLIFTDQTISTTNMIFGRQKGNHYSSLESLSGHKIAQMEGFSITEIIKSNYPNIEIIEVSTSGEALKLVATGNVDAHISNIPVASYHIVNEGLTNILVIGETPYKDSNTIGIPKTFPLLASSIQKAMKTLSREDKAEISKEWLVLDSKNQQNYNAIMQILGIAAIIIGSILLWAFSLRREISRRQIVEQELHKSQDAAEIANKAKSAFLANMSHEIRTPLNSIIGFTELVKSEVYGKIEGDKNKEYLGIVETSSHHLLALINDILDLSKVTAGQFEVYHEFIEVEREITKCVSTVRQLANNKSLTIDTQLEDIEIESDVKLFTQILINVLSNAIKFTLDHGKITIKNYNVCDDLIVEITDTGIGMDEDEVEVAISQFGQVQTTYTREHDGTGLGLPLVNKFMEALGGYLEIKSEKNVGTKILLFFPNLQNN